MSDAAPKPEPSWVEAERVAGRRLDRRLDRRRTYTIMGAEVFEDVRHSDACSGCSDWPEGDDVGERGSGCSDCGYTGRRRQVHGVPVNLSQPADNVEPAAVDPA